MSSPGQYTLPTLRQSGDLVLLKVRAQPAASREGIRGLHGDALKVAVHASPERGKANVAIEKVVAKAMGVRVSQVRVQSGMASRDKWLCLEDLRLDEARRLLAGVLAGDKNEPKGKEI